jgi:hypothetical protein
MPGNLKEAAMTAMSSREESISSDIDSHLVSASYIGGIVNGAGDQQIKEC